MLRHFVASKQSASNITFVEWSDDFVEVGRHQRNELLTNEVKSALCLLTNSSKLNIALQR